jgi:hypothetical protein
VCLDFVNTLDDRFSAEPKDMLLHYVDLARFAEDTGTLTDLLVVPPANVPIACIFPELSQYTATPLGYLGEPDWPTITPELLIQSARLYFPPGSVPKSFHPPALLQRNA